MRVGSTLKAIFIVLLLPGAANAQESIPDSQVVATCSGFSEPVTISIIGKPSGGEEAEVVEGLLDTPIALPSGMIGPWMIWAESENCWGPTVVGDGNPGRLDLELSVAGYVGFALKPGQKGNEANISFLREGPKGLDQFEQFCRIEGLRGECKLPAGKLDIRLEVPGFAPVLFWGVQIQPQTTLDLGRLNLKPGVSLSGWVEVSGGNDASAEVLIRRLRAVNAEGEDEVDRRQLQEKTVLAGSDGQFDMAGIEPGIYIISARKDGFSRSQPLEVELKERYTSLDEELLLQELSELTVALEPSLDPWQQPWHIKLVQKTEEAGVVKEVTAGVAAERGAWTSPKIDAGDYRVSVVDSQGGRWLTRAVTLLGGRDSVFWSIDVVPVSGALRIGEDPLSAILLFGSGTDAVTFQADEEGHFEGSLPREGIWPVRLQLENTRQAVEPVEVRIRKGKTRAEVEIGLYATQLKGRVTKEGAPAKEALLSARRLHSADPQLGKGRRASELSAWSDEEGLFEVMGLEPGEIEIRASDRTAESDWMRVVLDEEREVEVELELIERKTIQGRLTSGTLPVAGAKLFILDEGRIQATFSTGASGHFELRLNSHLRSAEMLVVSGDGAIYIQGLALGADSDSSLNIELPLGRGKLAIELAEDPPERIQNLSDLVPKGDLVSNGAKVSVQRILSMFPTESTIIDGVMPLPAVFPGLWQFCPTANVASMECQTLTILDQTEHVIEAR